MTLNLAAFTAQDEALRGGSSDRFRVAIKSLSIQGGRVELPTPGVTAFVGGNNVGKSTLLRQVVAWLRAEPDAPPPNPQLVDSLSLEKTGTVADLASWLHAHRPVAIQSGYVGTRLTGQFLALTNAQHYWSSDRYDDRLVGLTDGTVYYADTQTRLNMSNPSARRSDFTEPPTTPLQELEDSPELLTELSRIAQDAFQQPLVLDPLSGDLILRVGEPGLQPPPVTSVTPEFREAMGALPPLHQQGDGMRSMMGLLLPIVASTYPVVVVDEPEAFLHPPQARILGRELARLSEERGIQVILATHDKNILTGLLDAGEAAVSVVRLTRQGPSTSAAQLPANDLRSVWSEPSLRYSNILDGLFHRAVVLAENERDCRFYSAALDARHATVSGPLAPHDVLFVPTAGKTNIATLARTMKACGVPTVACADLDLLNDQATVRSVLESVGGTWAEVADTYRISTAEFRQPRRPRVNRDMAQIVASVLSEDPEGTFDAAVKSRLQQEMAIESPWKALKEHGMSAFRAERARAEQLLAILDDAGVVLVQVGELEGFAPSLQVRKGPGWVPAAISTGAHAANPAGQHVDRLVAAAMKQEGRQAASPTT